MSGPLKGVRIVEIAGIGPGPFAAMMLADAGVDVVRVDRVAAAGAKGSKGLSLDLMNRGRRSVAVDLKNPAGVEAVLQLVEHADALIEGFRPGVAERLGIGPEVCLERNPRLVYGRMTGWGQHGPLSHSAGHDIDYIALAGALHPIGRAGQAPVPPLNLVGDFGGGGLLLAYGMACALLETSRSGQGQVVDAAMVDGAAVLTTFIHGLRAMGMWTDERGKNLLDTGAHFYDVYETSDGHHIAVGAIEPQFYAELIRLSGVDPESLPAQMDRTRWDEAREILAKVFRSKTRSQWCQIFEGTDACVAPVLSLSEAPEHPHNRARGSFVEVGGVTQPAPAPRFSRTPGEILRPPPVPGEHTDEALSDWGFKPEELDQLRRSGAIV